MRRQTWIILGIIGMIWSVSAGNFPFPRNPGEIETGIDTDFSEKKPTEASIDWTKKVVRAKGNGFGPQNVKDLGRRKILAKRTAELDAYRNLLEAIKGIRVTAGICVGDMMRQSDFVKTKTLGMLKGMRLVSVKYFRDGRCEVMVEVNIDKDGQFLLEAFYNGEIEVVDNYPEFDLMAMKNDIEKAQEKLEHAQSRYLSLSADFKQKEEELNKVRKTLNFLEKDLKVKHVGKSNVHIKMDTTEKELGKLKNVIDKLIDQFAKTDNGSSKKNRRHTMMGRFLCDKKKKLEMISSLLDQCNDADVPDNLKRQRLLKIVQLINKNRMEIGERLRFVTNINNDILDDLGIKKYTGLLVDVRDIDFKPSGRPPLLTERKEKIYGIGSLPLGANARKIAEYYPGNLEGAKKKKIIAPNPLVVKAIGTTENKSGIILSDEDVKKMAFMRPLLQQAKVVIWYKQE